MSMERNYDWKAPVALVLAGLALFIALGGRDLFNFSPGPPNAVVYVNEGRLMPVEVVPDANIQEIFPTHPTVVPAMPDVHVMPAVPHIPHPRFFDGNEFRGVAYGGHWPFWAEWRAWFGQMPSIMPVLIALALVFIGWRLLSQNRNGQAPMPQAPAPQYNNPGPGAPPPAGPPYYGDINQRQGDS